MQRVHYKRLAIQLGGASEKDMAAKYKNRSDFSLGERTMDSLSSRSEYRWDNGKYSNRSPASRTERSIFVLN